MTLSQSAFSELNQEEKVNLITQTSPQLLAILWKDISTFSTEELDRKHLKYLDWMDRI